MNTSDYPALYISADAASLVGQATYVRLVKWDLILVVAAAGLGAISPLLTDDSAQIVAAVIAALLLVAVLLRFATRTLRPDREWFDGRAVAESVKSLSWRYMMRVEPYDVPDADADHLFLRHLREILEERKEFRQQLGGLAGDAAQITARMREVRALPLAGRKGVYVKERVMDQVNWYTGKTQANRRSAGMWFWIGLAGLALALLWAVMRVVSLGSLNLIGFFSSVAASVTAWTQLRRYDELSKSYGLAAQELMIARGLVEGASDEAAFTEAVKDAEGAISREHTMWVARRSGT